MKGVAKLKSYQESLWQWLVASAKTIGITLGVAKVKLDRLRVKGNAEMQRRRTMGKRGGMEQWANGFHMNFCLFLRMKENVSFCCLALCCERTYMKSRRWVEWE